MKRREFMKLAGTALCAHVPIATSHAADLRPMINKALRDDRVDALVVPIGKGELLCRRI